MLLLTVNDIFDIKSFKPDLQPLEIIADNHTQKHRILFII